MAIKQAQLTTTQLDLLTVPEGSTQAITNIIVCNTYSPFGASPEAREAAFTMYIVKALDSATPGAIGAASTVVKDLILPAGETFTFDSERIVLESSDMVSFESQLTSGPGSTDLSATISYLEV
jgi:hypothetical protein